MNNQDNNDDVLELVEPIDDTQAIAELPPGELVLVGEDEYGQPRYEYRVTPDSEIVVDAVEYTADQKEFIRQHPELEDEMKRQIKRLWLVAERAQLHGDLALGRSTHTVYGNEYEARKWARLKDGDGILEGVDAEGRKLLRTWDDLSTDCYYLLRRSEPVLLDPSEIRSTHRGHLFLTGLTLQSPDFKRLHALTQGNDAMTQVAAEQIERGWMDLIKSLPSGGCAGPSRAGQKHAEDQEALTGAVQAAQEALDAADSMESIEEAIRRAEEALERSEQQLREATPTPNDSPSLRSSFNEVVQKALDQLSEMDEAMQSWGVGQAALQYKDPKEVLALYNLLRSSETLRKIARLLGAQRVAIERREGRLTHKPGVEVFVDVGRGNKIEHLMPSEHALRHYRPGMFFHRLLERKALVKKYEDSVYVQDGPGIALIDLSGSMWSGYPFTYEEIAKATLISILEYFQDEGRGLFIMVFDDGVRQTWYCPPGMGADDLMTMKLKIAQTSYGGGTDFFGPMVAGFKAMDKYPYLNKSSMVIITDGQCAFSQKQFWHLARQQKARRVTLQTALMPGGHEGQLKMLGTVHHVKTALADAVGLAVDLVTEMDGSYHDPGLLPQLPLGGDPPPAEEGDALLKSYGNWSMDDEEGDEEDADSDDDDE